MVLRMLITLTSGRIFVLNACMTGAIIFWSYNAGLVSFLTVDNIQYPIQSLQVCANVIKSIFSYMYTQAPLSGRRIKRQTRCLVNIFDQIKGPYLQKDGYQIWPK